LANFKSSLSQTELLFFLPNATVRILPFDITLVESSDHSELVQSFRDIGPEHSRDSIEKTIEFMSEIEGAVAGKCHLEIQPPVTEDCMARQCPKH